VIAKIFKLPVLIEKKKRERAVSSLKFVLGFVGFVGFGV